MFCQLALRVFSYVAVRVPFRGCLLGNVAFRVGGDDDSLVDTIGGFCLLVTFDICIISNTFPVVDEVHKFCANPVQKYLLLVWLCLSEFNRKY